MLSCLLFSLCGFYTAYYLWCPLEVSTLHIVWTSSKKVSQGVNFVWKFHLFGTYISPLVSRGKCKVQSIICFEQCSWTTNNSIASITTILLSKEEANQIVLNIVIIYRILILEYQWQWQCQDHRAHTHTHTYKHSSEHLVFEAAIFQWCLRTWNLTILVDLDNNTKYKTN